MPTATSAIVVALVPGSNVITLVANDPVTGRDSARVSRTIVVGDGGLARRRGQRRWPHRPGGGSDRVRPGAT